MKFPPEFLFGAAVSAFQFEGAVREDGKGLSIWDTFSHMPNTTLHGDTPDIACDTYHRYPSDIKLMSSLGLRGYRFAIAWPRVQPGGSGPLNRKGVDYYRALLDELAGHGIEPTIDLYHWDLPQELQDNGGWAVRDTAERFGEYAALIGEELSTASPRWITLNEPHVVADRGYRTGIYAPGVADEDAAKAAIHHLLLAHGRATTALRSVLAPQATVGITLDLPHVRLAEAEPDDGLTDALEATRAELNWLFLDPVLSGRYPERLRASCQPPDSIIGDGDMSAISAPIDFLGVNYYYSVSLRSGDPSDLRANELPPRCGLPGVVEYRPPEFAVSTTGWLSDPDSLTALLRLLSERAPGLPLYITENGCAAEDYVDPDGKVDDRERVRYLHTHLAACAEAIEQGVDLRGYFVWSLLDNFESSAGYQRRFGIVFVDYGTQRRVPKSSARFYAEVIRAGELPPFPDPWPW